MSDPNYIKVDGMNLALPFLDYPTAWAIQRQSLLTHHPRCSSVKGWDPISGPHFLCDCGAVMREWERRRRKAQ